MSAKLHAIMYHYVRNVEGTAFPNLKGVLERDFVDQVQLLNEAFEILDLERMIAFLEGDYRPRRDVCILTFDDGLAEHGGIVTDVLSNLGLSGIAFVPTRSIDRHEVLPVHKNHFLLASLDFEHYRSSFERELAARYPALDLAVDDAAVEATYRWDPLPQARFKYLINYVLTSEIRNEILDVVFARELGDEGSFARWLYLSWEQCRQMQDAGMIIGGHSHEHQVLSDHPDQAADIARCSTILRSNVNGQTRWPFSYPYGKPDTYNRETISELRANGFDCAFNTEVKSMEPTSDLYQLGRIDPKDITALPALGA